LIVSTIQKSPVQQCKHSLKLPQDNTDMIYYISTNSNPLNICQLVQLYGSPQALMADGDGQTPLIQNGYWAILPTQ